jgi:hypothetical protein
MTCVTQDHHREWRNKEVCVTAKQQLIYGVSRPGRSWGGKMTRNTALFYTLTRTIVEPERLGKRFYSFSWHLILTFWF